MDAPRKKLKKPVTNMRATPTQFARRICSQSRGSLPPSPVACPEAPGLASRLGNQLGGESGACEASPGELAGGDFIRWLSISSMLGSSNGSSSP